jgi:hypothetical protein
LAAALTSTCSVLLLLFARCALAAVFAADILPDGESLNDEFLTVEFCHYTEGKVGTISTVSIAHSIAESVERVQSLQESRLTFHMLIELLATLSSLITTP